MGGRVWFRFDDQERVIDGVTLWLGGLESAVADWGFGGNGGLCLCGDARPSPRNIWEEASSIRFEVELLSLHDTLAALVQDFGTYRPVDDPLCLRVMRDEQSLSHFMRIELSTELVGERRHPLSLTGTVAIGVVP